jgi:Calcineurin-like phosphoesterase
VHRRVRVCPLVFFLLATSCSLAPPAAPLPPSFQPPFVAGPGDAILVGAGDIAQCGQSLTNAQRTGDVLRAIPDAAVFAAGDDAYPDGSPTHFAQCYDPTWGSFKSRTYPAPGNHDHGTPNLAGYFGYFGPRAPAANYSFDLGAWHVASLDSGEDGTAAEFAAAAAWLERDLQSTSARCIAAFWHHPRFSSGVHGNNPGAAAVWRVLLHHHADVILNGHDHDYERFEPQNENGQASPDGLRQFVIGTGGGALRPFFRGRANSAARDNRHYGVLLLALHPASYEWAFVATDGQVLDRSSAAVECHAK